jgi:hypothetical protein
VGGTVVHTRHSALYGDNTENICVTGKYAGEEKKKYIFLLTQYTLFYGYSSAHFGDMVFLKSNSSEAIY